LVDLSPQALEKGLILQLTYFAPHPYHENVGRLWVPCRAMPVFFASRDKNNVTGLPDLLFRLRGYDALSLLAKSLYALIFPFPLLSETPSNSNCPIIGL